MRLRTLAVAAVALAGGAGAGILPALAQSGAGRAVTVVDFGFQPATVSVAVGDTVTWSYPSGSSFHNVQFTDGPAYTQPATPQPAGWSVQRTFDTAGTYNYRCGLHASMVGTVVVGGGPTGTTYATTTTTTATTDTTPPPTTTASPPPDSTAPSARRVRVAAGRLRLRLSEPARLRGALLRGRKRVRSLRASLRRGSISVRLPARLRPGRYTLRFTLVDRAGNRSRSYVVAFTVARRPRPARRAVSAAASAARRRAG